MKWNITALALVFTPSVASASFIAVELVLVEAGRTTNPIAYDGPYDVYNLVATNTFSDPVTELALEFQSGNSTSFLQTGRTAFGNGPENPILFGVEAPDTFFALPAGVDAELAFSIDLVDTETRLAGAYTTLGMLDLIPARSSTPIATFSVPSGDPLQNLSVRGRAQVGSRFANVVLNSFYTPECDPAVFPEPGAALIAWITLLGLMVSCRRVKPCRLR